ncbi:sensor histidine kinase KdpD [Amycolatopsis sp. BJA-103]|uniref:sensor histidine kinase n=1 Tax=Amycolatopsis sp. BJA-103 TaxID=1911175 RepID=UPI000CA3E150|nr:HAMP domain-containing sensor histidine kinase [Amycolatopsis sp. BJA-103]AUI60248.1 two-component sensor histidine kinase [Amycolatopsis sp. BJA-103]PNE13541.1 two-component sensor histidine kinase [Amycolatopsis sp. BJA-103]
MTESSTGRLRRLRRLLTLLFTAMNAFGLVVLAWLVIEADAEQGRQRLDSDVRQVAATLARLVAADGGTIVTAYVGTDTVSEQCPQFAVLPGSAPRFEPYRGKRECVAVDDGLLNRLATEATATNRSKAGYETTAAGRPVYVAADPIKDRGGQVVGAIVVVADAVSTQERHEEWVLLVVGGCVLLVLGLGAAGYFIAGRAMRPATAALEQQKSLLDGVSRLLDGVVHDLKTPVAGLRALAEAALRNPAERDELLPRTIRLASMMGDIIDLWPRRARVTAGVEELSIGPLMLDQLVETVVEDLPAQDARITVTTVPSRVDGDATLLRRAVANLIGNALSHGRAPGEEAEIQVTVADGRVVIADRGPGVDPGQAAALFERFVSGGGSTGIGLAVVKWVADVHGGTLRVYNREQGGAIFELALPADAS